MTTIRQAQAFILAAKVESRSQDEQARVDAVLTQAVRRDVQAGRYRAEINLSRDEKKLLTRE